MLYAIMGRDGPNSSSRRASTRPRHLEYVKRLLHDGRLLFAGPHPAIDCANPGPAGFTGSLVIAEFESLEAAEQWAANDPYQIEGVFADVEVKPVVKALP